MARIHPSAASTDFSTQHFNAATLFADVTLKIEQHPEGVPGEYSRHQAFASGAVLSAVAFMEAYINELFTHCSSGVVAGVEGLTREQVGLLGRLWERGIPRTARFSILQKYEIALDLLGRPQVDRGAAPYQDASALVDLRNALVHFEPELYPVPGPQAPSVPQEAQPPLERKLRGRFVLNPLAREDFGFFPDQCLGAGCAQWAVSTSLSFVRSFVDHAGIVERFKGPIGGEALGE